MGHVGSGKGQGMIPFVDLAAQQRLIKDLLLQRIQRVLEHGQYVMGPEVAELEEKLACFVGVKHAVACSSGTDALVMLLMALGVGPGDGVLTTPFTFAATAEAVMLVGATPVFVDIDPDTFNLAPEHLAMALEALERKDSGIHPLPREMVGKISRARCVIAVDLFGLPADYDAICSVATPRQLWVIEDAAQSLGGERGGRRAGGLAHCGATSFFPAKPLGAYGDGGMCFTKHDEIASLLRSIRVHGAGRHRYEHVRVGLNGRLDTIQAAVLLAKLEIFQEELALRQEVATRYSALLAGCAGIRVPSIPQQCKSAWAQFCILAQDHGQRERLRGRLKEEGIPTMVYYPKPLHLQPVFAHMGYKEGDFPVSEETAQRILSLPMHPYLSPDLQEKVATLIQEAL